MSLIGMEIGGSLIALFSLIGLFALTIKLYYVVRKRHADSKFLVEFFFILVAFLLNIGVKIAVEFIADPPLDRSMWTWISKMLYATYSAFGTLGFGGLPYGVASMPGGYILATFYYGSSIYVAFIMVAVISARVSYEFYSYFRLLFSCEHNRNIYVFTALTEESITFAESIKAECEKKGEKEPVIVFGGPDLKAFERKDVLCRRVMADGFLYWSYSSEKKGSIAKILHLNNRNKNNFDLKFMVFAFDSNKHIPEEEENLDVVIKDMNERKSHPDRLFIEYVILTKRKINYQAYQSTLKSALTIRYPDGSESTVNGSTDNLSAAVRPAVEGVLRADDNKKVFRICAVGLGHNGGFLVNKIHEQLYYEWDVIHNGGGNASTLPVTEETLCIADVFDTSEKFNRLKEADEVGKHHYSTEKSAEEISAEVSGTWKDGYPILAYNYMQKKNDKKETLSRIKHCVLGGADRAPSDVITVALGKNEESIAMVNTICKWLYNQAGEEKRAPQYLILAHKEPLKEGWLKIGKKKDVVVEKKSKDNMYVISRKGKVLLTVLTAQHASLIASLTLFNEACEVGRTAVQRVLESGLTDTLVADDARGVRLWTIGFGGTGEAIANELFVQTPGVKFEKKAQANDEDELKYNTFSRPFAANVFDVKIKEAGELFRAEHSENYVFMDEPSWGQLVRNSVISAKQAGGLPRPVYGLHEFRKKADELYDMREEILADNAPDVITIATGDDYRNITYANAIGQWIMDKKPEEGKVHNYYIVVGIFDKNNNHLLSTYGTSLDEEKKEIKKGNLTILIANNLEDVYSFKSYMERRESAIQKHNTYERLTSGDTKIWAAVKELCSLKSFTDDFFDKGRLLEEDFIKLATEYPQVVELPGSMEDAVWACPRDYHCRRVFARLNVLFVRERSKDTEKDRVLSYENSSLWEKASNQSVVSAEPYYRCYFSKKLSDLFEKHPFDSRTLSRYGAEGLSRAIYEFRDQAIALEHDRWVRHHISDGWIAGKKKKPLKHHNCLLSYPDLVNKQTYTLCYDLANVMWAMCGEYDSIRAEEGAAAAKGKKA